MNPTPLDPRTTEKMLSGDIHPDDAPPGYEEVARTLRSAAAGARAADAVPASGAATIAAMAATARLAAPAASGAAREASGSRPSNWMRVKVVSAVTAGMVVAGAGLAFAGALPAPMQRTAATLFSRVGVHVPRGDQRPLAADPLPGPTPSSTPSATRGPDPNGPAKFGLCTAYFAGQGGTNGNKDNSTAFLSLEAAAGAAGQGVADFCAGAVPGGTPGGAGSSHGHGHGHGQGHGHGHSKTDHPGGHGHQAPGGGPQGSHGGGGTGGKPGGQD